MPRRHGLGRLSVLTSPLFTTVSSNIWGLLLVLISLAVVYIKRSCSVVYSSSRSDFISRIKTTNKHQGREDMGEIAAGMAENLYWCCHNGTCHLVLFQVSWGGKRNPVLHFLGVPIMQQIDYFSCTWIRFTRWCFSTFTARHFMPLLDYCNTIWRNTTNTNRCAICICSAVAVMRIINPLNSSWH